MQPLRESVRIHIRRLYFTHRLSFVQIGERVGMSVETIRDAIVLDGGLTPAAPAGPPSPGETRDRESP